MNDQLIEEHFELFTYPFLHTLGDTRQRKARLMALNRRWESWWAHLNEDERMQALDSTYFFLPYIREVLFPETNNFQSDEPHRQLGELERIAQLGLPDLFAEPGADFAVHLGLRPEFLRQFNGVTLTHDREKIGGDGKNVVSEEKSICKIERVELWLLDQGIGFLVLKLQVEGIKSAVELNEFLYYARQIHSPKPSRHLPLWECQSGERPFKFHARDMVDFLLQGLTERDWKEPAGSSAATFEAFVRAIKPNGSGANQMLPGYQQAICLDIWRV